MLPFAVIAQTGPTPDPWMQLGVAGLIVGFAVWVIFLLIGQNKELRSEIHDLRADIKSTNERYVQTVEKVLPAIAENTRVLSEVLDQQRRDELRRERRER